MKQAINKISYLQVIDAVCDITQVIPTDIMRSPTKQEVVLARRICFLILYDDFRLSTITIGDIFNKDHSTIVVGLRKIREEIAVERFGAIKNIIEKVRNKLALNKKVSKL